jgi:CRP-like cAMP-binding protein
METHDKIKGLRSLALFEHLSEARFEELTRFLGVERVPAGSVVIEEGSVGDSMYLLAEGQVRIEKAVEAGEFKELALLSAGDFFGEMALIEETQRSAQACAVTDSTLFVLRRGDLQEWLQADPLMATGFFVELLRVLSHRLRRTSEDLVLLHELSHLAVQQIEDEDTLLREALTRVLPHLGEVWCGAAYLYSEYIQQVARVAAEGPGGAALPETLPLAETSSRWLDDGTFCVALPGRTEQPLGFLVVHGSGVMTEREKAEIEVALMAIADLLSSAVHNIRHEEEARLRARLEHQRSYEVSY